MHNTMLIIKKNKLNAGVLKDINKSIDKIEADIKTGEDYLAACLKEQEEVNSIMEKYKKGKGTSESRSL